ncbi:Uma2 family endonuclease [Sorangium sp. So ce388]|uniref:Uma2 family endonuclease n=1 Tax=Sorangium sp. So ce388 TaxID=3133309 RepID=UPI003F5C7ACB
MPAPTLPTPSSARPASGAVLPSAPMPPAPRMIRRSEVVPDPVRWVLTEETVPESRPHDLLSERIRCLLLGWAARAGRIVQIGRNLAIRWDRQHPQLGVDPDVYLVEPPPPEGDAVRSLLLWKDGHVAPRLAVEIVSAQHPTKDYVIAPQKYAACGIEELWVLDPFLEGPRAHGGPFRIQLWRRLADVSLAQVHAGEGPAWSEIVQGWLHAVRSPAGWSFDLSTDEAGAERWSTPEEAERAAKEAAQRDAEAERAARDVAEQRIRELEALLARAR